MTDSHRARQVACDAKIHDDGRLRVGDGEIKIGRFDVAMDDPDRMKAGKRMRIARERRQHSLGIKSIVMVCVQDVPQRLTRHAVEVVHHKKSAAVLRHEEVDEPRETRIGNAAHRCRLAPEPFNAGFVQQMLYGDTPARRTVHRTKHLAEAAVPDIAQKPPCLPGMHQFAVADTTKCLAEGGKVCDAFRAIGRKRTFKQIPCARQQLAHTRTDSQRVRRRSNLEPALEKGHVRLRTRPGLPAIGRPPRQHFVQAYAQAENVRADISPERRICEIGRHVVEGADHVAAADGCRTLNPVRDLEVDELWRAVWADNDIRRLDVAVDNAPGRGVGQAINQANGNAHRFVRTQTARRFGQKILQRAPLNKLKHDDMYVVERPLLAETAVVLHNVRMLQHDKFGSTPLQPGVRLAIVILNCHHFQGDNIPNGDRRESGDLADGLIDGPLTPCAGLQVFENPEAADDFSGFVRRHQSLRPSLIGVPVTRVV